MKLSSGKFYFIRGEGVCRYQNPVGENHDVAVYDPIGDYFWGSYVVSTGDILREALPLETEAYMANAREAVVAKAKKPVRTQTCNNPVCKHTNSEPGGRAGCPKCGCGYERQA